MFDAVEDRPSVLGDPSTLPPLWQDRPRAADDGLESSRPRPLRPRVRRRSGGGWLVGLVVFCAIVGGGLFLLTRVLR